MSGFVRSSSQHHTNRWWKFILPSGNISLPGLHWRFTDCNAFSVKRSAFHVLMGKKCCSGKLPSSLPGVEQAWEQGDVEQTPCVTPAVPSPGCNLTPDLTNLSLLAAGAGFLPLFSSPHSLPSLFPRLCATGKAVPRSPKEAHPP